VQERYAARSVDGQIWLIWDGECGFCRRCVRWVLRHDRRALVRAAPYQHAPDPPLSPELRARAPRAVMVVLPDGRALQGASACAEVLRALGHERAALLERQPLALAAEGGYRLVAANRSRIERALRRSGR
jgi:predicted DCC family thiol-disulfide oxidoreductase YuxK